MTEKKESSSDKLDKLSGDVQSLTFDNERVIKPAITDIKEMLHRLPNGFATKEDVGAIEKRVTLVERFLEKNRNRTWVFNTVSAGAGAILFWLVQYVLTHR